MNTTVLKKFIPKTFNTCLINNNHYLVMENLKYGYERPLSIDIKFGFNTSNKKIMKIKDYNFIQLEIKTLRHLFLDKLMSHSSKFGFRIEGASLDKPIPKNKLMNRNVFKVLYNFFKYDKNNIALNSFISNMQDLIYDVSNNNDFNKFLFVGSSILFTYDASHPEKNNCKLIDFDNTLILDNPNKIEKNKTLVNKTILSFENILNTLEQLKLKI